MDASQEGIVVGPGAGRVLLADRWWLPVQADDTPSGLALIVAVRPARGRPHRPNRHNRSDKIRYILVGRLTSRLGSREAVAGPGTTVAAPRGVIHQVHNCER